MAQKGDQGIQGQQGVQGIQGPSATLVMPFSRSGVLVTGAIPLRWRVPGTNGITIVGVLATVNTPSGTSAVIVDLNRATAAVPATMTSLYTTQANRPSIAAGAYSVSAALPNTVNIPSGDFLQAEIDQIGAAGNEGRNLTVQILYTLNP
jgi:hypothetical protein